MPEWSGCPIVHGDQPARQYQEAVPAIEWEVLGAPATTIARGVGSDGLARAEGGVGSLESPRAESSDVDPRVGSDGDEVAAGAAGGAGATSVTGWNAESGMAPGKRGSMPVAAVVASAEVPATRKAETTTIQERGARLGNALDELGFRGHEVMLDRLALQKVRSGGVWGCQAPVIRRTADGSPSRRPSLAGPRNLCPSVNNRWGFLPEQRLRIWCFVVGY